MNVNFLEFDAGWLWFILAAYGLTQILVYGSIFDSNPTSERRLQRMGQSLALPNVHGILGWRPSIHPKRLYRTIYI